MKPGRNLIYQATTLWLKFLKKLSRGYANDFLKAIKAPPATSWPA